jgi:hypothetical protein
MVQFLGDQVSYDLNISLLIGKTLAMVWADHEEVHFVVNDTEEYKLWHSQDCCESVYVESIVGDLADLQDTPILNAEEVSGSFGYGNHPTDADKAEGFRESEADESYTWTFYKLSTIKGSVTIRFLGSSNGYYSERVDFDKVA